MTDKLIYREMYENEMRAKEEEYLHELARKDEILLTTVCQFEDKITELQSSVNNLDVPETPRVRSQESMTRERVKNVNCQTSRGAQTQSSILSDSGSFIEDDNPEQLTIQPVDTIKIMADVEEDVRRQVAQQISELQTQLKDKEELIENLQRREETPERLIMTMPKEQLLKRDENDNFHMSHNSFEDQLEGQGEKSVIISTTPKLLRLQSVQDQAKAEMKR